MEGDSEEFRKFVWVKENAYPYWPALIIPKEDTTIDAQHIYFFGTHDYNWCEEQYILPYIPNKEKFQSKCNGAKFKAAIEEIEEHILKTLEDPNYTVPMGSRHSRMKIEANIAKHDRKRHKHSVTENKTNVASTVITIRSISTVGIINTEIIGDILVEKLSAKNFTVNVWDPTKKETTTKPSLANYRSTPLEVVCDSDIVFICLKNQKAVLDVLKDDLKIGVIRDCTLKNKNLLLCTSCHPEVINEINIGMKKKGGNLLDVLIKVMNTDEGEETLLLHASGNKVLFDVCQISCFKILGYSYYHSELGYVTKMNLIMTAITKICKAGLAENFLLAQVLSFAKEDWLNLTSDVMKYLIEKMNLIGDKNYTQNERSVLDIQNTMRLAIESSEQMGQQLVVNKAIYKRIEKCVSENYGNRDISGIFSSLCRKCYD